MRPATPVIPGQQEIKETVIAKDRPEYLPLPSIIVPGPHGEVLTRWELTDEEKVLLLSGGHIYLSIFTFGDALQPILLRVATPQQIMEEARNVQFSKEDFPPDVTAEEDKPPS